MTVKISGTTGVTYGDNSTQNSAGKALIVDQKPSGTSGGDSVAGNTLTRTLNTLLVNDIGVTINGTNSFTLQPGQYWIEGYAPAFNCAIHRAWICKASDLVTPLLTGEGEYTYGGSSGGGVTSRSRFGGRLIITVATEFVVRHYTQLAVTGGLGTTSGIGAAWPEMYTRVLITKEK